MAPFSVALKQAQRQLRAVRTRLAVLPRFEHPAAASLVVPMLLAALNEYDRALHVLGLAPSALDRQQYAQLVERTLGPARSSLASLVVVYGHATTLLLRDAERLAARQPHRAAAIRAELHRQHEQALTALDELRALQRDVTRIAAELDRQL